MLRLLLYDGCGLKVDAQVSSAASSPHTTTAHDEEARTDTDYNGVSSSSACAPHNTRMTPPIPGLKNSSNNNDHETSRKNSCSLEKEPLHSRIVAKQQACVRGTPPVNDPQSIHQQQQRQLLQGTKENVHSPPNPEFASGTDGYISFSESDDSETQSPLVLPTSDVAGSHGGDLLGLAIGGGGERTGEGEARHDDVRQEPAEKSDDDGGGSDMWDFGDDDDSDADMGGGGNGLLLAEGKGAGAVLAGTTSGGRGDDFLSGAEEPQTRIEVDRLGRRERAPTRWVIMIRALVSYSSTY